MYRVLEGVRSTHGPDGAVVLDIRQGRMFKLNFVGSRILELFKGGATQSRVVDALSREFAVKHDMMESDVREFLDSLKACHLVEELPSVEEL